jgi:hypothetical protein
LLEQLSKNLLLAVKTSKNKKDICQALAHADSHLVEKQIISDELRKSFWLNIYNAYTQILLSDNPQSFQQKIKFFGNRFINIAGTKLSLDDIEHGILRKSRFKYGLGYVSWPSRFKKEKDWQLSSYDARIHFALNCGATSCPVIAVYSSVNIEEQLEKATLNFLQSETKYDTQKNVVYLSKIFFWFYGDFGGRSGIIHLLHKHQLIPLSSRPRLRFLKYDWRLQKGKFLTDS